MKNIFSYIWGAMLSIMLVSCFDDKGNYDYDPTVLEITDIKPIYTVLPGNVLSIKPKVTPETGDYEYSWGIYLESYIPGDVPPLDTIARTKDLEWNVDINQGVFLATFTVRNKSNGVFKTVRFQLTTGVQGWYVLKSQGEYTDIDMFYDEESVTDWIAKDNGGIKLKGEAVGLAYTSNYQSAPGNYIKMITAFSKEDMMMLDVNRTKIIRRMKDMFFEEPATLKFEGVGCDARNCWIINDGKLQQMTFDEGRFGIPLLGDYKLSNKYMWGGIGMQLFFDELTQSFCKESGGKIVLCENVDSQGGECDYPARNLNADLLYAGVYFAKSGMTLLRNKTTGAYMFMPVMLNQTPVTANPVVMAMEMPPFMVEPWINSKVLATYQKGTIIYYIADGYICSIDMERGKMKQLVQIPEGEEVTCMEHLYSVYDDLKCFVVATEKDGKYIIRRYSMEDDGTFQITPLTPVFHGDGSVKKVLFISPESSTINPPRE